MLDFITFCGWIILQSIRTFCLSIHLLDTWAVSPFWLLWIMLLWTLVYKYIWVSLFNFLGCILVVKLLDHMVSLCLSFWGMAKMFFTEVLFYICTSSSWGFQFLNIFSKSLSLCLSLLLIIVMPVVWSGIPLCFWFVFS